MGLKIIFAVFDYQPVKDFLLVFCTEGQVMA